MHDVNWWLMAVAFVCGLVLTLFSVIGRAGDEQAEKPNTAGEE